MAASKTATLTLRTEPDVKEALQRAAELEHHSIANMVEVLIREHCEGDRHEFFARNDATHGMARRFREGLLRMAGRSDQAGLFADGAP